MKLKTCRYCKEQKGLDAFPKDSKSKDGKSKKCRACKAEDYRANREKYLAKAKERYRKKQEEILAKAKEDYRKNKEVLLSRVMEYQAQNADKVAEYRAKYYRENKERIMEQQRSYRSTPKGAAAVVRGRAAREERLRNAPEGIYFPQALAHLRAQWLPDTCPVCEEEMSRPHLDHFVPVSKGGANCLMNVVYVCASCNLSKQDKLPGEHFSPEEQERLEKLMLRQAASFLGAGFLG